MRNRLDAEQLVSQVLDRLVPDGSRRRVGVRGPASSASSTTFVRRSSPCSPTGTTVTQLALEVGNDEAPAVEAWLHDPDRDLETLRVTRSAR